MNRDRSYSEVHLDIDAGRATRHDPQETRQSREDAICRIAICGDFSGRADHSASGDLVWRVDRDDFDEILADIAPTLQLELKGGMRVDVRIRDLDDFHPDQLFEHVPQFASLRALRAKLDDPATFARAAEELAAPAPVARPSLLPTGSLLDTIVGGTEPVEQRPATDDLYAFIQNAMAPYLVARTDPRQAELLAQVDGAISALMRELLHHPKFQALESLWRGVFRLVREVDTDERLQVHVFDLSRRMLDADLAATGDEGGALRSRLQSRASHDDGGWGVLVAHFGFGGTAHDIETLRGLAELGASLGAPWLAEAQPDLAMGELPESVTRAWQQLRGASVARHLGLALPRVLLRLPYGRDSESTERFAFEEFEHGISHAAYLWGNPAVFCATLLAQGFSERGNGLAAGASSNIEGLPMHLVRRDGTTTATPCAEVVMREEDAIALLDAGFIPMCSLRDQDVVRVPRIQSIAVPAARLGGRLAR